jgi:hypothetical protein
MKLSPEGVVDERLDRDVNAVLPWRHPAILWGKKQRLSLLKDVGSELIGRGVPVNESDAAECERADTLFNQLANLCNFGQARQGPHIHILGVVAQFHPR